MINETQGKQPPKKETFVSRLDPGKVAAGASSIVSRAADILEENIAEGIVIAKRLEGKVLDVDRARTSDENALMHRFRKDAHEALDIFFDALTTATHSLNDLVSRVGEATPPEPTAQQVPELTLAEVLAPGQRAQLPLQLENESSEREMKVSFGNANLETGDGRKLNARNITYDPKELVLKPGERGEVTVKVRAPKNAVAGRYRGLIQDKELPGLQAMLTVEVGE